MGQSDLQTAILSILNVFNKYAKLEGGKDKLSQSEVKKLIEVELSAGPLSPWTHVVNYHVLWRRVGLGGF
uniref:S100/CaBP-9k-type calcium binding subdomain domain-containing protein n=1 Tax=Erpetoichthys calabaricus TaxID=27687 RepID=A0A8C4RM05_ERPCA